MTFLTTKFYVLLGEKKGVIQNSCMKYYVSSKNSQDDIFYYIVLEERNTAKKIE